MTSLKKYLILYFFFFFRKMNFSEPIKLQNSQVKNQFKTGLQILCVCNIKNHGEYYKIIILSLP